MAGTKEGVLKTAAKRIGVPLGEYVNRRANGEKWCSGCREWHLIREFPSNDAKYDQLSNVCLKWRKSFQKSRPPERKYPDREHARAAFRWWRIKNNIPSANAYPCVDCGHLGNDRQHHYDHYLGYSKEHWFTVHPVCSKCHRKRHVRRDMSVGV